MPYVNLCARIARGNKMPNGPKAFISCSRSSTEHQKWVLSLATQLHENNVDVISDKWDLREGNDAIAFMEQIGQRREY
jgi:hypothetical protein